MQHPANSNQGLVYEVIYVYIYIYPDFNASIVIVIIVEEVVVVLLTGGGGRCGWSELTHESYKETLISGLKYQFAIKLIIVSLAGIIRSSAETELVYRFDCKLNHPVTWGHHERICLGPEFSHVLHLIYQYMLGCCIHMYFIFHHRLHAHKHVFQTIYGNWLSLDLFGSFKIEAKCHNALSSHSYLLKTNWSHTTGASSSTH